MSAKNKGLFSSIIWFASGLSIRDLAKSHHNFSDYIGIGGLNLFSTITIGLISSWSSSKFFSSEPLALHIIVGLIMTVLVFSINRQSIKALTFIENLEKKQRNIFALFPLFLFSIVAGITISIPVKFYVFGIDFISDKHNILEALTKLDQYTDIGANSKLISWVISLILIILISSPTLIKYYTIRNNYQKETSSMLNEFMWFCSGANKDIVRRCPNEHSKYFGIGGTILFTALMASLSGGYAITTVFKDVTSGICFGAFWGALIFNLDRFIVNTMYSDGKHTISKEEIFGGLPRLIIAIFLGIVISYPIELKIFETEINRSMKEIAQDRTSNDKSKTTKIWDTSFDEKNKTELRADRDNNQNTISNLEKSINTYSPKTLRKSKKDDSGNIVYFNVSNPSFVRFQREKQQEIRVLKSDIAQLNTQISSITSIIVGKGVKISEQTGKDKQENDSFNGLSTRMRAFSDLKSKEPSTEIASIFIMLLFIIIEISPVLFKMMISAGDYDLILKTEKDKIRAHEIEKLSRLNDWANTEILKVVEENKMKVLQKQTELDAEFKANEVLLNTIAEAQVELSKIAVERWKEEELKKIKKDPNYFIKSVIK